MTARRGWILVLGLMLVVAAGVLVVVRRAGPEQADDAWDDDLRVRVRVIHGDWMGDVELTDYPVTRGRVSYEGPRFAENEENWKPSHAYRGVDLAHLLDEAIGLATIETVTLVALDGWHKTLPRSVLSETTVAGTAILALSIDDESSAEWDDAPMLVFLPTDERFSNQDMLDALGPEAAHYYGDLPSVTGLMVKGVTFLVINHDGGPLPTLADL